MKRIELNVASAITVLVCIGAFSAALGAWIGYNKGYILGDSAGRHAASRLASVGVSDMLTRGFSVKTADGSEKTYILQPIEAPQIVSKEN